MTANSSENENVNQDKLGKYVRQVSELWEMWKPRVKMHIYPFSYVRCEDVERVMTSLPSYDRDNWASAWSSIAKPYEEKAAIAENVGDTKSAKENYLIAYPP
jgi:hypothetical protein